MTPYLLGEVRKLEAERDALRSEVERLKFTVNDLDGLIKDFDKERDELKSKVERLKEENQRLVGQLTEQRNSELAVLNEIGQLNSSIKSSATVMERYEEQMNVAQSAALQYREALEKIKHTSMFDEHHSLNEMRNNMDDIRDIAFDSLNPQPELKGSNLLERVKVLEEIAAVGKRLWALTGRDGVDAAGAVHDEFTMTLARLDALEK